MKIVAALDSIIALGVLVAPISAHHRIWPCGAAGAKLLWVRNGLLSLPFQLSQPQAVFDAGNYHIQVHPKHLHQLH
jgi:hypothetical protein